MVVVMVVVAVVVAVVVVSNIPQEISSGIFIRTIPQECPIEVFKVIMKNHSW